MSIKIDAKKIFSEYEQMLEYNAAIKLDETVRVNENFFVGKQWEGVEANGLPTPVFNFLKRVTLFTVASNTSESIKLKASPLAASSKDEDTVAAAEIINNQFESLFEHNSIPALMREYMRNAAVDGDSATYTYWDSEAEAGNGDKGAIVTEIVQNTRVGFGNTADRRVQTQPYILIKRREMTETLKKRAKKLKCPLWEDIKEDDDDQQMDSYKEAGGKTTVILRLWKDDDTKTVWACETCKGVIIREPWDLGLKRYPVTWLCWDYIQDSYHGQAMLTGLIPNQIYINKLFAMTMLSLMTTAYPKIVYDKTKIAGKWNNGIGQAIGVNGDVNSVARILDPAQVSPQIAQFITMALEMTQSCLGATSVALGDARPDNTSAIIALQRAAATPNELTKQNMYRSIEELGQIYIDFMAEYYGERKAETKPILDPEILEFAGVDLNDNGTVVTEYDFKKLKAVPVKLKLDVGASAYWSEIASTQTLDNLLMQNRIDIVDYLERIPDGYITDRQGLIFAINQRRQAEAGQMFGNPEQAEEAPDESTLEGVEDIEEAEFSAIPTRGGKGNGALQRQLKEIL